jgi:hypothetical protein
MNRFQLHLNLFFNNISRFSSPRQVPRPLLTKWCLDDSPAVASAADLREAARSSFADGGLSLGSASTTATGRAISLIPLTEDAPTAAEVFVTTATSGNSGGGGDVELIDQFAPLRLSEDSVESNNSNESSGIILLRDSSSRNDDDNEVDASQTKPKFATQQFEDFVDFGSF